MKYNNEHKGNKWDMIVIDEEKKSQEPYFNDLICSEYIPEYEENDKLYHIRSDRRFIEDDNNEMLYGQPIRETIVEKANRIANGNTAQPLNSNSNSSKQIKKRKQNKKNRKQALKNKRNK